MSEHVGEAGILDGIPRTSLPVTHLMYIEIRFRETQIFGTPVTTRMVAVVQDGTFTGPRLRGEVLPGGGDWLVMGEDRICRLDIRATLLTDDGEYVYLTNTGRVVLTDADAGRRYLAGETLRAQHMHARTAPLFETGAEKYAWRGGTVNIGFVELSRSHITYRIYTVAPASCQLQEAESPAGRHDHRVGKLTLTGERTLPTTVILADNSRGVVAAATTGTQTMTTPSRTITTWGAPRPDRGPRRA